MRLAFDRTNEQRMRLGASSTQRAGVIAAPQGHSDGTDVFGSIPSASNEASLTNPSNKWFARLHVLLEESCNEIGRLGQFRATLGTWPLLKMSHPPGKCTPSHPTDGLLCRPPEHLFPKLKPGTFNLCVQESDSAIKGGTVIKKSQPEQTQARHSVGP